MFKNKFYNIEMQIDTRIWCQQDFQQFYEQQPKIHNITTYRTVSVQIQSSCIKVKIPSNASQQFYQFLLYKGVYYHYLNNKQPNPLYKTAQVSFFEEAQGYQMWYRLWKTSCLSDLKRNCIFTCIRYDNRESMDKYILLAVIEEQPGYRKILGRSKKDGKYYDINQYKNMKQNQNRLLILQDNKKIQHPFIIRLHELHKTSTHTFLIFQHSPYKLQQFLLIPPQLESQVSIQKKQQKQKSGSSFFSFKLREEQIYTYFCQFVIALVYLEQRQINNIRVNFDTIDIGLDGHLILNQKIFSYQQAIPTYTQRNKSKIQFLNQFFNILIACSDIMDSLSLTNFQQYTHFSLFLIQLSEKKRPSLRQIINHSWFQKKSTQQILSKSCKTIDPQIHELNLQKSDKNYHKLTQDQVIKFFNDYHRGKKIGFQSFKIEGMTKNQRIIGKYGQFDRENQDQLFEKLNYWQVCKKRQVKLDSILSRNSCKRYQAERQQNQSTKSSTFHKSPYLSALKKERIHRRKKYLKNQ